MSGARVRAGVRAADRPSPVSGRIGGGRGDPGEAAPPRINNLELLDESEETSPARLCGNRFKSSSHTPASGPTFTPEVHTALETNRSVPCQDMRQSGRHENQATHPHVIVSAFPRVSCSCKLQVYTASACVLRDAATSTIRGYAPVSSQASSLSTCLNNGCDPGEAERLWL